MSVELGRLGFGGQAEGPEPDRASENELEPDNSPLQPTLPDGVTDITTLLDPSKPSLSATSFLHFLTSVTAVSNGMISLNSGSGLLESHSDCLPPVQKDHPYCRFQSCATGY